MALKTFFQIDMKVQGFGRKFEGSKMNSNDIFSFSATIVSVERKYLLSFGNNLPVDQKLV